MRVLKFVELYYRASLQEVQLSSSMRYSKQRRSLIITNVNI